MCVRIHICVYVSVCVCVCVRVCVCVHVHTYIHLFSIHPSIHPYIHTYITYVYMYICMHPPDNLWNLKRQHQAHCQNRIFHRGFGNFSVLVHDRPSDPPSQVSLDDLYPQAYMHIYDCTCQRVYAYNQQEERASKRESEHERDREGHTYIHT